MVDDLTFYSILSLCYFVGGLTIGYYFSKWKNNTGRWDYGEGRYPGRDGEYYK